ncbi:hypothetical protein MSG28_015538 [Choristoneura fumiferana]|uniref:Uncharacterized protein n=1 Tax=Choristoneura fumiferana TaxID=7141 RepID=A0ACC0KBD2_CHOFU|nr:hypothetical protein MSG28_015538 [Choristoneura fumiferana]
MKCIIFCLVLAVAAASPVSDDQDARRRLQALQLTLLNDIDDNKQSPNSGSVSDSKPAQTAQQYDGSEVVIGGHDHEATSTSRDTLQRNPATKSSIAPKDYDKSDDQTSYYTTPYLSNLKNKETQHDNYQRLDDDRDNDDDREDDDRQDDDREDDDREDDDREDDDREDDDRQDDRDDDLDDDNRQDDDREDDETRINNKTKKPLLKKKLD